MSGVGRPNSLEMPGGQGACGVAARTSAPRPGSSMRRDPVPLDEILPAATDVVALTSVGALAPWTERLASQAIRAASSLTLAPTNCFSAAWVPGSVEYSTVPTIPRVSSTL